MSSWRNPKAARTCSGQYDIVKGWPKDISTLPGNEKWTYGAGQSRLRRESQPHHHALPRRAAQHQAPSNEAADRVRPEHSIPHRPPALARCDHGFTARRRSERLDPRRAHRRLVGNGRRRCEMGELHRHRRRERQHRRALDPVGQDSAAPALRRDQPLRSGEARLDRRRSHGRHLQVHARRQAAGPDHRHAQGDRRRRDALQSPDVPGVAARQHHVRRRRLQRNARRQVRQERQVPAGLGQEGPPNDKRRAT